MNVIIVFCIFVILLTMGILPWILSSIWSTIMFIDEYWYHITAVVLVVLFVAKCISCKRKEEFENMKKEKIKKLDDIEFYEKTMNKYKNINKIYEEVVLNDTKVVDNLHSEDMLVDKGDNDDKIRNDIFDTISKNLFKIYISYLWNNQYEKNSLNEFVDKYITIKVSNDVNSVDRESVVNDKNFRWSIIDEVVKNNQKDLAKIKEILNKNLNNEEFNLVDLDKNSCLGMIWDDDLVYTHKYLNKNGIDFENNNHINRIYNGMITEIINNELACIDGESEQYCLNMCIDNINDIINNINNTITKYLKTVYTGYIDIKDDIIIRVKEGMSIDDLKNQIVEINKNVSIYSEVYGNYVNGSNMQEYFQYTFRKFPAPYWSLKDINFEINFNKESKTLFVECILPDVNTIPTRISVRGIIDGSVSYVMRSDKDIECVYDDFIYQYMMAVVYYAFECDEKGYVDRLVLNCKRKYTEKALGRVRSDYVASISFSKDEYNQLDFYLLDARECFRYFNGTACESFIKIKPITPTFLNVAKGNSDNGSKKIRMVNLVEMPWRDFEFLIKELFDRKFKDKNYSLQVTRGSRDGGVDIVIHDYDPINGGTILVQVKRYSHIVGIEAVRALYGIFQDHAAMKGILVTTGHFGREAQNFVKNKPLTLIDGEALLKYLAEVGLDNFYIE